MFVMILRAGYRARLWLAVVACLATAALSLTAAPIAQARAQATASRPPATFVTSQNGAIVLVSAATGQVVRSLTPALSGRDDSQPFLADGGRSVVFVRSSAYCSTSILSVSISDGATRTLVPTTTSFLSRPKLSRDGELLAYHSMNCQAGPDIMNIRTVRTGATHVLAGGESGITDYTFTPDGRRLVVIVAISLGGYQYDFQLRSVPVQARDVAEGSILNATDPGYLPTWITRIGQSHDLAVAEYSPALGQERIIRVDGRTGHRTLLATIPGTEPGLEGIDFDARGQHLLIQGQSGNIYTTSDGAVVSLGVFTAPGFQAATW